MKIEIVDAEQLVGAPLVEWLRDRVGIALGHLSVRGGLAVSLTGDTRMAEAHLAHCGVAGTTDVITFDFGSSHDAGADRMLDAELLICVDEGRRSAASRGVALEHELLLYIIHGVLHCLGHDDHDPQRAAEMHRREDEILGALGLPAVYAAPVRGGDDPAALVR